MVFFSDPPSNPFKLKPWLTQFKNGVLTGNFTFGSDVAANTVYAGPTAGGDANPTFRLLVAADIPNLDTSKITTGGFDASRITSGTIDDARIDWASPPNIGTGTRPDVFVDDLAARSALVQNTALTDTFLKIGASGLQDKFLQFQNYNAFSSANFSPRWNLVVRGDDTGGDAGSDLFLERFDDSDTKFPDPVFEIDRQTGTMLYYNDIIIQGNLTLQGVQFDIDAGTVTTFNDDVTFNDNITLGNLVNIIFDGGELTGLTALEVEELYVSGGLANVEITNGVLNMSSSSITFTGTTSISGLTDLEVTGNITSGLGSVTVDDNFVVTGTSDLRGTISNSTGVVTVGDALTVTGAGIFQSTIDLQGNISNSTGSVTISDNAIITGTLDQRGAISNSTGNVTISDSVDMTGTFTLTGAATVSSTLTVTGSTICNNGARMGGDPGTGVSSTVIFTNNVAGTPSNNVTPSAWLKIYNGTGVRYMPIYT